MRRNRIVALVTVLSMLSLSGCMGMYDLTNEQSDLIAEYSAGVLLRYSDRYERRLITKEQLADQGSQTDEAPQTPTASAEPTASGSDVSAANSSPGGSLEPEVTEAPAVSVNDLYHLDGVTISYDSYQFVKKYESSLIRADEGETLLIVSFSLKNVSNSKKKINLLGRDDITYSLDADGMKYEPGISILDNGGLNQLSTELKPGKKEKAVLIYRMKQEQKNAASITLTIADGNRQSKLTLR